LNELITPRNGVLTLSGYGISLRVERGHLLVEDGIGERRTARISRVRHGIQRVVVIGSDGMVTLAALEWLSDQGAAFVMLERDGKVLATTGPVRPSDARLRRAQALAHQSGIASRIARELIHQKLVAQQKVIEKYFGDSAAVQRITNARERLAECESSDEIRSVESQAALAYWSAWHNLAVTYPRTDLRRVPDHWQTFGTRMSPLTNSPRYAVNPANAMLNYLYAVLESESRLALAALGLDPGLGFLHNDSKVRDSLACDLMEPVRPQVDAFLLDWLGRGPLRRDWFFEQRDGNCRLMGSFAVQLSQTASTWRDAVAPFAEGITKSLWSVRSGRSQREAPPTRLTHNRKREAKGIYSGPKSKSAVIGPVVCRICGATIKPGFKYCRNCVPTISRENILKASKLGRLNTHTPTAQARRSATKKRQDAASKVWRPTDKPLWLDRKFYDERVMPSLLPIEVPVIQRALSISEPYALRIRAGKCVPHPRHWLGLARIAGFAVPARTIDRIDVVVRKSENL
jgi:CRISPR-associated endonuclease Cas1